MNDLYILYIDLFLPIISFSNSYSQILIFKKKEKKDFIESMENIAELFVEFSVEKIVEKLRDKDPCLTPRSHPPNFLRIYYPF